MPVDASVDSRAVVAFVAAALVAVAVMPILRRMLVACGLVDRPGVRSSHTTVTPRGGGYAVILAACISLALVLPGVRSSLWQWVPLIGCVLIAFVGALDDWRGLSARTRLVAQLASGGAIGVAVQHATGGDWPIVVPFVGAAFVVATYVNAFNFMDGINGISSITATISCLWMGFLFMRYDAGLEALTCFAVAGGTLGFLPWNFPRASAFLGDVGSYFLGAFLAAASLSLVAIGAPISWTVAPMAVYLLDTGVTLLLRIRRKEQLFAPHNDHFYQRLARARGHSIAAMTVGMFVTAFIAIARLGDLVPVYVVILVAATAAAGYLFVARRE